jgi:hypothetical protein
MAPLKPPRTWRRRGSNSQLLLLSRDLTILFVRSNAQLVPGSSMISVASGHPNVLLQPHHFPQPFREPFGHPLKTEVVGMRAIH